MHYTFRRYRSKQDKQLAQRLNEAGKRLKAKLKHKNVQSWNISAYNKRYIGDILSNLTGYLQIFSFHLELGLRSRSLQSNPLIVDYGGGAGIMSLLAMEAGYQIIYCDIYDVSANDFKTICHQLKYTPQAIITGDIEELTTHLNSNNLLIDTLVASDVIEHIYDINSFVNNLSKLKGTFTTIFGTGANHYNPRIKKRLEEQHLLCESVDRSDTIGHKRRDTLRSFKSIRSEIIKDTIPDISTEELERLASQSRGLRLDDLKKELSNYSSTSEFTYIPNHPTNTCDPYTGNWIEQFLAHKAIMQLFYKAGFQSQIISGPYMYSDNSLQRLITNMLNILIQAFPYQSKYIAPYYYICAVKQ
ncbi:hypothetical protein EYV94_19420 [Puteibacter caeruleilacunae]|nr:hypothetical protein EYV94_19420 [Puteibacter caeruleilacunae]